MALAILLAKIVDGAPDVIERELASDDLGDIGLSRVSGSPGFVLAELAAEDEADEGFEENGEKTEPNTRFAFSLDASFLSSTRYLEGFFGSGVGG